jgi:hypothetical protein
MATASDGRAGPSATCSDELSTIEGLERLRYTTSHPRDMDDALIAAHGTNPKVMPYLHLPVQSGSDRILKAMNRKHTAESYVELVARIRDARPDIAMSSDFIVGFPGETDEDFEATMQVVREVTYAQAFSFKYSRPLYDALYDMMPGDKVERAITAGVIEIAPLAFMRGRTLANAAVILDEAQNTTQMQMKMFLTRLGENSRMIITGDPSQVDLPRGVTSGLVEALSILEGVDGVVTCRFRGADVVRHPLVQRIVEAYDKRIYPKAEGDA